MGCPHLWWLCLVVGAVLCVAAPTGAVPVEETPYGKSGLRLEIRPDPKWMSQQGPFEKTEGSHVEAGVSARWISVMDPLGSPHYASAAIPTDIKGAADNGALFRDWVAALHARGVPVVSWYPLIISKSGAAVHPEWRQKFIGEETEGHTKGIALCFHTGYGQALIDFCNEAIGRFGLDGIWFDGSAWTQIWDRPIPLSCVCDACRAEFRKATGLDLPARVDWSDPSFRRWVAWRYDAFGAYIGRIARGIRSKHPNAAVVINHYHRPSIPWQGAIPLNPYEADIITGSEATGPERVDLTMRLCTAYGRKQSEVWRPFNVGGDRETDDLVHHALACITAGGMPSFGGGLLNTPQAVATAKAVSGVIDALRPTVGGEPVKDVALHLSQQSETFHFSRAPKGVAWDLEPFWASIETWTDSLGRMHRPPTYLYDRSLTSRSLAGYRVLLLPMSQALSDPQARCVVDFVRSGGTAVLGIGCGQLDEWGEPRAVNPLGKAFGFALEGVPSSVADETQDVTLAGRAGTLSMQALRTPVRLAGREWKVLCRHSSGDPAVAERPFGKGAVLVSDCDPAGTSGGWQPVTGGDTSIAVTEERARQGKHALKLVDGPNAPYPFCPDMEINFAGFGLPRFPRGRFSCDLWAGQGAAVNIELRSRVGQEARLGPSISITDGKVSTQAGALGELPVEEWVHVEIAFRFSEAGASYDLTLSGANGFRSTYPNLPCVNTDYAACNWAVLFGAGKESASFFVDNLRIERLDAAGSRQVALADDFEATPVGGATPGRRVPELIRILAERAARHAPPVVEVEAPESVRVGAFRQAGRVVVHLHNRAAGHRDWKQPVGLSAALRLDLPVKRARSAVSGVDLPVTRQQGRAVIVVPHVGLHEAVLLSTRGPSADQ